MSTAKQKLIDALTDLCSQPKTHFGALQLVEAYAKDLQKNLRDEFALACADPFGGFKDAAEMAREAYKSADALLIEREKPTSALTSRQIVARKLGVRLEHLNADDRAALPHIVGAAMRRKLKEHESKGHWRNDGALHLAYRLQEEVDELINAVSNEASPLEVEDEAGDVANFAGIISENYRRAYEKTHDENDS